MNDYLIHRFSETPNEWTHMANPKIDRTIFSPGYEWQAARHYLRSVIYGAMAHGDINIQIIDRESSIEMVVTGKDYYSHHEVSWHEGSH